MKKKILIFIIIFIVLSVGTLTVYKLLINKNQTEKDFKSITLEQLKPQDFTSEKKDSEIYSSNIISNIVKNYDYELIIDNKGLKGKVSIGNDSKIYISDNKSNINKLSEVSFKTLYKIDKFNILLNLYALSEDGKLYYIFLSDLDIKKTEIVEIPTTSKIVNFTDIKVNDPYSYLNTNIIVLSENGNMYEPRTGIRYTKDLVTFFGEYYILEDQSITNAYGNLLKNGDNNYKIKYYVSFLDDKSPFKDTNSFIITEDKRIIYCEENSDVLKVYNKKIKTIEYKLDEKKYSFVNIKLTFEDNSIMDLEAIYTEYYGFE